MAPNPKSVASPLNGIWLFLIVFATLVAAYNGTMAELTAATFEAAENAVSLAIGLIGALALWLGLIKVVEVAGLMQMIARAIRPVMVRLFPEVPADHPAMSAMVLNMAANALGLGNAATPMGLKAMAELDKLNPASGTATNAMCLFLAINTSSVTLLPISAITVRASAGATNPGAIILPSLVATLCSTAVAILAAKLLARRELSQATDLPRSIAPIPRDEDLATGAGDAGV
jgi:spore maturation protein SpmA